MKITVGPVTVRYYPTPTNGYQSWTVVWHTKERRWSKRFPKKDKAETFAKDKADELAEGHRYFITAEDRASIARAHQILKPTGKPLELVASEYAMAFEQTDGATLAELVAFWKAHRAQIKQTIPKAIAEFTRIRKADHRSDVHVDDLTYRLDKFKTDFGALAFDDLTGADLDKWLRTLKAKKTQKALSARSRKNYRTVLCNFFAFCIARRYLPRGWSEMEAVPVPTVPKAPIEIFTAIELGTLLKAADKRLMPFLAIGSFAGLRHAELARLDWADIKLGQKKILVREFNKTGKRTAPIPDNLVAWLDKIAQKRGRVVGFENITNQISELGKLIGGWRHNAPRHSFISYRVAETGDIPRVSFEAGNSVGEIKKSYLEVELPDGQLISETHAKEWFAITP